MPVAGQIVVADEVTYGTYVAGTRAIEFTDESLQFDRETIWSEGIRAGRRVQSRHAQGVQRVVGDITMELAPQGTGILFKHIFGGLVTTGAGPYTHTFTPGTLTGKSMSVQVGRPFLSGTVQAFSILGAKITEAEIAANVNEYATLTMSVYGNHEDTASGLAVAAYPATLTPFVFTHGSLTVGGSAVDVRNFTLTMDNALIIDRHFIRATTPERSKEPLEGGYRQYTGSFEADFESLTAYNRYVGGTQAAMVLTFNAGASAMLVITMNVMFDGETPTISSPDDLVAQTMSYKAVSTTSDAAAITAVLTNADATA
jgi:hypothetical protein